MTSKAIVQYSVKKEYAAENERLIAAVFEQINREKPEGLSYASFSLPDGVSFVHIVSINSSGDDNPLGALSAFRAFTAGFHDRCEIPPRVNNLQEIGSYEFFRS